MPVGPAAAGSTMACGALGLPGCPGLRGHRTNAGASPGLARTADTAPWLVSADVTRNLRVDVMPLALAVSGPSCTEAHIAGSTVVDSSDSESEKTSPEPLQTARLGAVSKAPHDSTR